MAKIIFDKNVEKENVIYWGLFIQPQYIERHFFGDIVDNPHVTMEFVARKEDKQIPVSLMGNSIPLKIDAFGIYSEDGVEKNKGYRIADETLDTVLSDGKTLRDYFKGNIPHITLQVVNGGKPVDTWKCNWQETEPFVLIGTFGCFCK